MTRSRGTNRPGGMGPRGAGGARRGGTAEHPGAQGPAWCFAELGAMEAQFRLQGVPLKLEPRWEPTGFVHSGEVCA